jgi:hypothetical protein
MDDLVEFLRQRQVPEDMIDIMEREKVLRLSI